MAAYVNGVNGASVVEAKSGRHVGPRPAEIKYFFIHPHTTMTYAVFSQPPVSSLFALHQNTHNVWECS